MPYFSKRLNFFGRFSCLIAVRYLISFGLAIAYLLYFFVACWQAVAFFVIVLHGIFVKPCDHVTEHALVAQKLDFQLLIEVGWRRKFKNPVQACGFFLNRIRQ